MILTTEQIKAGLDYFEFPYEHYTNGHGASIWTFTSKGDGKNIRATKMMTGDGGAQLMLETLSQNIKDINLNKIASDIKQMLYGKHNPQL
jgi:hypothetical protein